MLGDVFRSSGKELADQLASVEMAAVKAGGTASEFFNALRNEGEFMHDSLGLSFDEIRDGLTGLATGSSISAEKISATLGTALTKLQQPSQDAIAALNELGIARKDVFDDSGQLAKFGDENPFVSFLDRFKGADAKQLTAIFGPKMARSFSALVANTGKIRELAASDWGDPSAAVAQKARNAKGFFGELSRTIAIFKNTAVSAFTPVANFLAQRLRQFNDWLANLGTSRTVATIGSIVAGLVISLLQAALHIKTIVGLLKDTGIYKYLKDVVSNVADKVKFIAKKINIRGIGTRIFPILSKLASFFANIFRFIVGLNPLVLLTIAAFLAWGNVIRQLYGRWDDFCLGVSYLIDMLKEEFFGFIDSIMEAWSDFWRVFDYLIYTAKEWFANFVDGVKSYFYGLIDGIKEKIQQLVGYLPDFVKTKLGLSITSNNPAVDHVTPGEVHAAMKAAHDARVGGDVNVNFANAPAGMRVTTEPRPGTTLPTNVGYNLLSPAWGMGG